MTSTPHALVRIATRSSLLALWQANHVADLIREAAPGTTVELVEVSTTGDRVLSQPLRDFGGLGVFTREVQVAVIDGRADVAVHSLKDLPTESTPGLALAAIPERGETADALVLPLGAMDSGGLLPLVEKARVATGSPRRQAQLLHVRPDLQLMEVRGNVQTRLNKLDAGEFDAMILACAGLERLGLADRITRRLTPPLMYHAVSQGALGLECRSDDAAVCELLHRLIHAPTWAAAIAERSLLSALRAGCHAPVGVATKLIDDGLHLEVVVLSLTRDARWIASASGPADQPVELGRIVAAMLVEQGASAVLTTNTSSLP
ncbi:MAG TPA: hydroxymethylbilane synthase [Planctomycetaceae bacterium]|nr:hydroxymethylbilane synthase [Planctomycetaceae bacterium]